MVLPPAVVTVSLASSPAGPGAAFCTSTRIVLSAPGLSWAVTSAELRVVPAARARLTVDDEMAVDREPEEVVGRRDQLGLLDLGVFGKSQRRDEQAMALGLVRPLVAGMPDPLGPVERGARAAPPCRDLVGADPLGLAPVRRLEQAHGPEPGWLQAEGLAVLVPDPDLPVARLVRP